MLLLLTCRPKSEDEVSQRTPQVIQCEEAHREVIMTQQVGGKQFNRTYHFDKVFSPETTQVSLNFIWRLGIKKWKVMFSLVTTRHLLSTANRATTQNSRLGTDRTRAQLGILKG